VDEGVAPDARHVGVDLGYDYAGAIGCGLGHTDFNTEAAKAVLVGWRDGDEGNIYVAISSTTRSAVASRSRVKSSLCSFPTR